jgi:hypothetical protein
VSFTTYHVQPAPTAPGGAPVPTVASLVSCADARALAHALAWERNRRFLAPTAETADEVLALREIVTVVDAVEGVAAAGGGPLHLTQPQVVLLVEAAALYTAERDVEDYTAPAERERLGRLRTLSDRLMGIASEMAAVAQQHHHASH